MGGGEFGILILVLRIPNHFAIRTIKASAWRCSSWILLLVVAGLALIEEVVIIETYLWVVAVHIIKPYLVMDYEPRLLATDLADPAIHSQALIDEGLPGPLPGRALVELFLGHLWPSWVFVPYPNCTGAVAAVPLFTGQGIYDKKGGDERRSSQKETRLLRLISTLPLYADFPAMHCQHPKASKKFCFPKSCPF